MNHLVVVAALVALPLAAIAGPEDSAQAHVEKATEAHQQGNYDVARAELEAAYAIDPQPDLLYAIGQVQVKLDNCAAAIEAYEKFLATSPGPEATAATNEAIETCRTRLASQPPPPDPVPEPTPEPTPPPEPPPAPEARRFDPIGASLVGVGVVSSLVGVILYSSATGALDDAEQAGSYMEHALLVDDARTKRTYAVVFGVAGAAAIGIGAWHYLRFRKAEEARIAIAPTTSGGMITWMGRF